MRVSFASKDLLDSVISPSCTNIDIDDLKERFSTYVTSLKQQNTQARFNYPRTTLNKALIMVMKNNRMTFGDTFIQQMIGTAVGVSPASPIANLYVAIHTWINIHSRLVENISLFHTIFIDDGIGVWIHNDNEPTNKHNWETFKLMVNGRGLAWEFSELFQEICFMDRLPP